MDLISIFEAAKKLSISRSLINYYVEKGLLALTGDAGDQLSSYEFDELCKIVLLQTLGISITDTEALQAGRLVLADVLKKRINEIMSDPDNITQAAIVCQNIRLEGCDYRSLKAMPHLEHIQELKSRGGVFPEIVIPGNTGSIYDHEERIVLTAQDNRDIEITGKDLQDPGPGKNPMVHIIDPASGAGRSFLITQDGIFSTDARAASPAGSVYPHPFKRFLARGVDMMIYMIIVVSFIRLVFELDPVTSLTLGLLSDSSRETLNPLWMYTIYLLMFIIEPLVIHFTGTTPGKLIFGVRILDASGRKLSLKAAYIRSFNLLRYGYGFMIPIYTFYRYFRSFMDCQYGVVLPWDRDITLKHPDNPSFVSIGLLIPAVLLISFINGFSGIYFEMPKNKAPLTEEQFYENFAHVAHYNSISTAYFPDFDLTVENGIVTGVSFTVSEKDLDTIYVNYYPMYVAFMAFAGASEDASAYSVNYSSPAKSAFNDGMKDFSFDYAGVNVTNTVSYTGYNRNIISGYLYKNAQSDTHEFTQTFEMKLAE
ncbi:MAG: RDD family protein [Lachnospiraceae bacterium]|nr:RDD family protein [Lachnospiraceae bacterium]